MEKRYAKILSTGMYLPEKVITNEELSARYGFDVNQFLSGITLRHIAAENESASDLAVNAALEALKKANMSPEEIDLLIMTTDAPDYVTPPTSPTIA
ncbi:MAG: ketoacyl-ACP synthase III, partial [Fervidobacterium sp.]